MINWIKNLFRSRDKQLTKPAVIHSITCGERDENGFCDTYVNGKRQILGCLFLQRKKLSDFTKS